MGGDFALNRVLADYPSLDPDDVRWRLFYSTFVNIERKYLYFEVPKSACTSLKWLIHTVEGLPEIRPFAGSLRESRRDMFIHDRDQFKLPALTDFDNRTQEEILSSPNFLRFTVVRNPYARLISAWFDKVYMCDPGYEYIYSELNSKAPTESRADRVGITFEQFVQYVSRLNLEQCDHHWRLQTAHCFYKSIDYNFVGRVESLDEDIAVFLRHAGFAPHTPLPKRNVVRGTRPPLTSDLAERIYTLYEKDFGELGYAKDSWHPSQGQKILRDLIVPETGDVDEVEEIRERNIVIGHLYNERHRLNRELEEARLCAPPLEQYDSLSFGELFNRYISQIDGWLSKDEAQGLYEVAKAARAGCIVEVGSYRGRSTATLGLGTIAGANLPVYAIEPHEPFTGVFGGAFGPDDRGEFMRNMLRLGLYRQIRLVNTTSSVISDSWPMPVSVLWIDADHRYEAVRRDFLCWRGKLAPDAAVVFDDAQDRSFGPGKLVSELIGSGNFALEGLIGKVAFLRFVKK